MWVDLRQFRGGLVQLARCRTNCGKWGLWGGRMIDLIYYWGKWDCHVLGWDFGVGEWFECRIV